jgi:uncharacterized cupin superfamily protein
MDTKKHLIRAGERPPELLHANPDNLNSEVKFRRLAATAGLVRLGIGICTIPPRKEGFGFHIHYSEEEFIFILSGKGIAEIGEETFTVEAGDFLGFPAGSCGHHLKNTGDDDLVFLSGGENHELEVCDYPRSGKRLVRVNSTLSTYPINV